MDLLEHLRRQFAYDAWANREVLAAMLAAAPVAPATRPLQLLAHIVSAERLWLERLRQQPQSLPVWPEFGVNECAAQIAEVAELWREYLAQLSPSALADKINYKNSKGEPWSSTVLDVATHVVMHSAYHRGQIASLMRAGGGIPAYTDFIHAVRQGLVE
jgi:uncharacterized damage-inducible protein DinB